MKVCFSGGAKGSDYIWSKLASHHGYQIKILSFDNHRVHRGTPGEVIRLSDKQLEEGIPFLKKANRKLERTFPSSSEHVNNLLLRNYCQLKNSNQVVAIGTLDPDRRIVSGGTGRAVQMAIDLRVPTFVYDQALEMWLVWTHWFDKFDEIWEPPKLLDKFTGIGTRKVKKCGIHAAISVFERNTL